MRSGTVHQTEGSPNANLLVLRELPIHRPVRQSPVGCQRIVPRARSAQRDEAGVGEMAITRRSICSRTRAQRAYGRDVAKRCCRVSRGGILPIRESSDGLAVSDSKSNESIRGGGEMSDPVNHPEHYTSHPSGVECIKITEHMGFCLGNAVKYIWRAGMKGDAIEDLQKARFYIDREIKRLEGLHHKHNS